MGHRLTRTLWRNAIFLTLDSERPETTALVTEGEWIRFAGPESVAASYAGSSATIVDLGGKFVVPGFNDNHLHLVFHGDHALCPDLAGLDEHEVVAKMRHCALGQPADALLVGYAWDAPACSRPHKALLDEAFPSRPVALAQFGGHAL